MTLALALILLVELLQFFALDTVFTATPLYVKQAGGSDGHVGLMNTAGAIVSLAVRPLLARGGERRGFWAPFAAGGAAAALFPALYFLVQGNPLATAVVRALHTMAPAAWILAGTALVAAAAPADQRGNALGWWGGVASLSLVIAPAAGIRLYLGYSLDAVLLTSAACAALGLAATLWLRRQGSGGPPPARSAIAQPNGPMHGQVWLAGAATMIATGAWSAMATFLPIYALQRSADPALAFTALAGAGVVGRLLGGRLSDRAGRRAVALPAAGLMLLGLVLVAYPFFPGALYLGAALAGAGTFTGQTVLMAHVIDWSPAAARGRALAVSYTGQDLGHASGAALIGFVAAALGYSAGFLVWAALALLGALLVSAIRRPAVPGEPARGAAAGG